ncbi:MAG TPA: Holliday junction resolvase-like protein [Candidatus Nanoarchaeia archaeon]|nr:Holliday junction resolvase-like protein [Candidatus Nanoarchaeia archaeon]
MIDTITLIIILIALIIAFFIGQKIGAYKKHKEWEAALPEHRQDAIMRSRAVLGGHFSEQLAPYLPDFDYLPTECRFIGKPIDFLVFKGMDEKKIDEVVFVEVKSGNAKLTEHEKNLKETIDKKRVKWVEYRIPEELTKKGDIGDKIKGLVDGEK